MKVLMVNGSPRGKMCTYTALCEVQKPLVAAGFEVEFFHVKNQPLRGCCGCGGCRKNGGRCIYEDGGVNELIHKAESADAFVFGTPVHYASASGAICSLLDRSFYANQAAFAYKPAAAIASCRREGGNTALDRLHKYIGYANMPLVHSRYWNIVYGNTPQETLQDAEGMQVMQTLGENLSWMLRLIQAGHQAGVTPPVLQQKVQLNMIR